MDNITNNNLVQNLPEERGWEYKQICVTRVPGYGFGIAVSGGRDNPHFASGDPSIAVSDVLASGPAERLLQVNDRIISVNGISLQNVDYATAVQVLRDSGDTVTLVIKRRTIHHQHSHSLSYNGPPLAALGIQPLSNKITLTKNSKKEDFGIVLGCKLFIKEISTKARDQLLTTNQILNEGDFITKINNTNCNDLMSLKEAKKIIDSTKDKLQLTIARDTNQTISTTTTPPSTHHQQQHHHHHHHHQQSSISTTGAVNNFYKGDDYLTSQSYSNQNLYVQPPTRNPNLINTNTTTTNTITNNTIDDKNDMINSGPNSLIDDKSNLTPRSGGNIVNSGGRSRGPLSDTNLNQLDNRGSYGRSKGREEPPRPPPPRAEDYYSTRRQIYDDDPIVQKKQPIPDARFVTFHKEGSVGIRLTGGNFVGIFVTAVQPGSPASLQGLQPGDKILKVNDMDMNGVTREEAVLFLLSLQDRIELIVQYCKEEYDSIVASQKGDSFYVKTHFHYDAPAKGEMSFRSGDIFHVIDTLYNGVVGSWQVYRIGRNNQEVQKGIIPNKSRAEELATAQFNATKKEMSTNESRGSFFRRRRSSNRRSKSLGKEHWDDILFSDTVSKFPAYERVLLKHPGFTRPVILFGPIADVAREKLLKDFPDKFISPHNSANEEHGKSQKSSSNIIRLSATREVISTGKHALLDITPNAVERLNYAQMYPIVVFFKADTKMVIKQLRQGLPKSAHKSSKKLLEQCQKLDKVWNHIFSATVTLNDNTDNWYRKVREIIDKQQSGALWMSESKPEESLSDDFLFPMSSLRLSYASSPESDLEHSPGPRVSSNSPTAGRLTKASSDPSVVMPDNNTDVLPPYQPTYDTRYGFNNQQNDSLNLQTNSNNNNNNNNNNNTLSNQDIPGSLEANTYGKSGLYNVPMDTRNDYSGNIQHKRQPSTLHGYNSSSTGNNSTSTKTLGIPEQSPRRSPKDGGIGVGTSYNQVPDLPPRIDRAVKPIGLLTTPNKIPNGRSAHERLFGTKPNQNLDNPETINNDNFGNKLESLERNQNSKLDSLSSYDSFNKQSNPRIGPNAHDDLKTTLSKIEPQNSAQNSPSKYNNSTNQQRWIGGSGHNSKYLHDNNDNNSPRNSRDVIVIDKEPVMGVRGSIEQDLYRSPAKSKHMETKTDYGKYSRNNTGPDYTRTTQDLNIQQISSSHHHSPMKSPPVQHHNGFDNGLLNSNNNNNNNGGYKPIPPPKPKNYKPPYKQGYDNNCGVMMATPSNVLPPPPPPPQQQQQQQTQQSSIYQHGKSHSNPVDQRSNQNLHNYYYNMPQDNWHTETAVRYNTVDLQHYDMTPPYETTRRHPSISYASRSEITPIAQHENPYGLDNNNHLNSGGGGDILMDPRPPERANIVDLQGSREQRGSAFELYRKPMHHNLRVHDNGGHSTLFGSQPNLVQKLNPTNNNNQIIPKLTKTQSFKHQTTTTTTSSSTTATTISTTTKLLRKLSFKSRSRETTPKPIRKLSIKQQNNNNNDMMRPSKRDITSAIIDHRGGLMVNHYWGVSLEVPEGALPHGTQKEIYFVITDPRLMSETDHDDDNNRPPLDLENGERMLSPIVMCGPQGTEFLKPVILNIPHYANTLPSLGISLKATDSEQNIHTDWDNILLPSNHAANSVAVKVDHF